MHRWLLATLNCLLSLLCCNIPNYLVYLVVLELVEYPIWPNKEIVVLIDSILFIDDLRLADDDSFLSSKVSKFSFTVTKGSAYGKPTWKHSVRTNEGVVFVIWIFGWGHSLLLNLLSLRCWKPIAHDCLGLVYVATCIVDPLKLTSIRWFVISWHLDHFGCSFYLILECAVFVNISILDSSLMDFFLWRCLWDWGDCPRITDVEDVDVIVDN